MIGQRLALLGILGLLGNRSLAQDIDNLESLITKYSQLTFIIFTAGSPREEGYPNASISQNTARTLDEWLQDKPGIEKIVQEIYIHDHDISWQQVDYKDCTKKPFYLCEPTFSIHLGERGIDPNTFTSRQIRDLTSELQILDHEFVHIQDGHIRRADQILVYERQADESQTLEQKYKNVAVEIASNLYKDSEFLQLLADMGDIGYPTRVDIPNEQSAGVRIATLLYDIGIGLEISGDPRAAELLERWNSFLEERTGLYTYSFKDLAFAELPATYAELPVERARKNIRLAQLEFDRAMSIVDAPQWLREQATTRYFEIMGGEEGKYCRNNKCGPCLEYTLTCKIE